jgi:hypothetical protein
MQVSLNLIKSDSMTACSPCRRNCFTFPNREVIYGQFLCECCVGVCHGKSLLATSVFFLVLYPANRFPVGV